MNKTLTAEKVKDGYVANVTTTYHCSDITDVKRLIRMEGLKIRTVFCDGEERIFADCEGDR